ncbi:MAG: hypothetical protein KFB93_04765 [Simkaniaceae bacterium]|nr:MAG: hypothetical protein KFB93_04765 [Simkaniaceae bacterium]
MRACQCFILLLLFLSGCEKYYLSVKREHVDQSKLASTYVGSPDPRQKNPPKGQELIMEWRLPRETVEEKMTLVLELLYKNYTQETISYPVSSRRGVITYSLIGKKYKEKEGLLTYKAEIRDEKGTVLQEWKQQLWTELIVID